MNLECFAHLDVFGETHHDPNKAESMGQSSNLVALFEALKQFFMDNPAWE